MVKKLLNSVIKNYSLKCSVLVLTAALFLITQCGAKNKEINAGNNDNINIDPIFDETSLFLAGKDIPKNSSLYQYSQTKEYVNYCKQIESHWEKLQEINTKKILKWKEKHLPEEYTDTIYYPFSGPDILNALIFFPNGKEYTMFGLEAPGEIPQPHKVNQDKLHFGLKGLWQALDTVLNVNFFKTNEMKKEISTNDFDSITSVMMFFLARTDYEVLNVRKIWINEQSVAVSVKPKKMTKKIIPGTEIFFRKKNEKSLKKVTYFQIDVSNHSLANYKNYTSYIESKGRLTTIIKSASYLMHRENEFNLIRGLILSQSDFLLQDDSGIPLKSFMNNEWKLSFHGVYTKPINLFAIRYQEDLSKAFRENSTGLLDFSYGYNFKEKNPNLMFAERIKK
jgi:hypothetical protein